MAESTSIEISFLSSPSVQLGVALVYPKRGYPIKLGNVSIEDVFSTNESYASTSVRTSVLV